LEHEVAYSHKLHVFLNAEYKKISSVGATVSTRETRPATTSVCHPVADELSGFFCWLYFDFKKRENSKKSEVDYAIPRPATPPDLRLGTLSSPVAVVNVPYFPSGSSDSTPGGPHRPALRC
jgi:hypothetical protein